MVNIKGFHGTLDEKANKILNSKFIHSSKNSEWLGSGVYFFAERKDAEWWADLEIKKPKNKGAKAAVLVAEIITQDNNFFDFDIVANSTLFSEKVEELITVVKSKYHGKNSDAQVRHALCDWFAEKYNIDVYAYTFPIRIIINDVGFPVVQNQRQICVRNDACITNLHKYYSGGELL